VKTLHYGGSAVRISDIYDEMLVSVRGAPVPSRYIQATGSDMPFVKVMQDGQCKTRILEVWCVPHPELAREYGELPEVQGMGLHNVRAEKMPNGALIMQVPGVVSMFQVGFMMPECTAELFDYINQGIRNLVVSCEDIDSAQLENIRLLEV
jgi:hypothetical protein